MVHDPEARLVSFNNIVMYQEFEELYDALLAQLRSHLDDRHLPFLNGETIGDEADTAMPDGSRLIANEPRSHDSALWIVKGSESDAFVTTRPERGNAEGYGTTASTKTTMGRALLHALRRPVRAAAHRKWLDLHGQPYEAPTPTPDPHPDRVEFARLEHEEAARLLGFVDDEWAAQVRSAGRITRP